MSAENPKYWGSDGDEILTCLSIQDFVDEFVDNWDSNNPPPETVDIVGYDPMVVDQNRYAHWTLENLLESLDDEYAGEDPVKPTEAMNQAAAEFVAKISAEYQVWNCEIVCRKTVKIADYITQDDAS